MSLQHLSDEAVAAYADGVLTGLGRERARRHCAACTECAHAVRVQREAALTLRTADAPALPTDLLARLRAVPTSTLLSAPPTVLGPDGTLMFPAYGTALPSRNDRPIGGGFAPMAALVPPTPTTAPSRLRPIARAAVVAMAVGAVAVASSASAAGTGHPTHPANTPPAHFVSR